MVLPHSFGEAMKRSEVAKRTPQFWHECARSFLVFGNLAEGGLLSRWPSPRKERVMQYEQKRSNFLHSCACEKLSSLGKTTFSGRGEFLSSNIFLPREEVFAV